MKPSPSRLALSLLCILATFAPARTDTLVATEPAPDDSFQTALGAFALDIYREVASTQAGKNVFCSPYSLSNALAMCAEGAQGATARELGEALRFPRAWERHNGKPAVRPWNLDPLHTGLAALNKRYNAQTTDFELRVANALWVDKMCLLQKDYLEAITRHYRGGVYGVDFHNDPRASCRLINTWAKQQTRGRVKELLNEDSPLTRLVITNAVHFKADWAEAFKASDTADADFVLADGKSVKVKTMVREKAGKVRYGAFDANGSFFATPAELSLGKQELYPDAKGFCVLEMPYKGGEMAMVVVVPRSEVGLGAVEKLLSPANLTAWLSKLEKRSVHVHVPRFTMEAEYDLSKPLQAMGMKRAFVDPTSENGAQFGGLAVTKEQREMVFVTRVVHKAFVEVNEQGTEAAAATAVASSRSVGGPFTPAFKADRPFVFLIRDTKSGTILFVGRVADPRPKG